jgi:hypothetical protein
MLKMWKMKNPSKYIPIRRQHLKYARYIHKIPWICLDYLHGDDLTYQVFFLFYAAALSEKMVLGDIQPLHHDRPTRQELHHVHTR